VRDADASIAGVRSTIQELNAALLQVQSELRAGGDVNQNDKWTLRLLGLGVLMLGLCYPVGKIIWIATTAVARRRAACDSRTGQPRARPGERDTREGEAPPDPRTTVNPAEYYAFRQRAARRAEMIIPA
jgi:hypothetical protein